MTLEERLEQAHELRSQGYNCAQCVFASFPDITGLDREAALRLSTGLGGGVGGCGQVCGVVSAMALLEGYSTQGRPADKAKVYAQVSGLYKQFATRFGSAVCHELKAAHVPCNELIFKGIEMYHQHINND